MKTATREVVERYEDRYEHLDTGDVRSEPQPYRKSAQRILRQPRKARLGIKGRNRSRSVHRTL